MYCINTKVRFEVRPFCGQERSQFMLIPAKDFFDNLPVKMCSKCGSALEEQSECYETMCSECQDNSIFKPFVGNQDAR
ncbi:protein YhfH [Paenibacillus sp. HJGM_3]|uniref:protein YhfH n=1 Tax=Paenibacillus sp. HJGM_3 TaxID=3379816 RepID=UPI00385D1573